MNMHVKGNSYPLEIERIVDGVIITKPLNIEILAGQEFEVDCNDNL